MLGIPSNHGGGDCNHVVTGELDGNFVCGGRNWHFVWPNGAWRG